MPPARAIRIAIQIARALTAAHRQRIVHRDLKPENIMLLDQFGEPDFVKVLDFGIARFLDAQTAPLTGTGAVIGTPAYMSPEQAQGRAVDETTDLYALGVILYEMLSGRAPLVRGTAMSTLMAQVTTAVPLAARCRRCRSRPLVVAAREGARGQAGERRHRCDGAGGNDRRVSRRARFARVPTLPVIRAGRRPRRQRDGGAAASRRDVAGRRDWAPHASAAQETAAADQRRARTNPPAAGRSRRGLVIVAGLVVLGAAGAGVAMRTARARQLNGANGRLDQLARARHEPRPRGCPRCSLADLQGLLSAARSNSTPEMSLATLETVAPLCSERWTASARLRLAGGDVAGARADAAHGVAVCPTDALAHHLLGSAAMKSGDTEQAAAQWREAVALSPTFAAPLFNLALNALAHRDPMAAIQFLDEAIAQDAGAPNVHLLRGRAKLAAGDRAGAAADLTEAVRRAPEDADAWKWLDWL